MMTKSDTLRLSNKAQLHLCFIVLYLLFFGNLIAQESPLLDSLKSELRKSKKDTNRVDLLHKISRQYIIDNVQKKLPYLDEMLELSIKLEYHDGTGRAYASYADHFMRLNKLDESLPYLEKLDSMCKNGYYKEGIPVSKNLFGNYYKTKGNYEEALIKYHEALSYYEKTKDKRLQSATLSLIANMYYTMKRYKDFEEYNLKSINISREVNDKRSESINLSNLASLFLFLEQYDKAEKYLDLSMELQKELKNPFIISKLQRGKGAVLANKGSFIEALETLESAYSTFSEINDTIEMGYTRMYQADVYRQLKEYDNSVIYMDQAIDLARKGNADSIMISDFYIIYYTIHKDAGNYKEALHYYEKAIENQDELFSVKTDAVISELKEKYETTQKEQELVLIREKERVTALELEEQQSKIRERTYLLIALGVLLIALIIWMYYYRKQKVLKIEKHAAQLEHKALRAQMNPHFIFNALHSIQRIYVEGDLNRANDFMADFAQLMRKILENSSLNKITLSEEIETLRLYMDLEILRCKSCFRYTIHIDESLSPDLKIAPLILQPFVENSIWHGVLPLNNKEGLIDIQITDFDKDNIQVVIKDNGVGFDSKSLLVNKKSKAISITKQRIGENLLIESEPNKGTRVTFKLKKK